MDYPKKLVIRIVIALALFLIPINIFYLIYLKPTLVYSFLTLSVYNPILWNDSLIINNDILKFVPACIASIAYYLLAVLILFTKDLSFKKMFQIFVLGSLIIFIANIIRIDLLIIILLEFGVDWFNKLHLLIWRFLSTIFVVIVWIFLTKLFKIKTIPVYSDLKYLWKHSRN